MGSKKTKNKTSAVQSCGAGVESRIRLRGQLVEVVEDVVKSCYDDHCFAHIDAQLIPSWGAVVEIIERIRALLFPGYFEKSQIDSINIQYHVGKSVDQLFDMLSEQIAYSLRHECGRFDEPCAECTDQGYAHALQFLQVLPVLRRMLACDVRAAHEGDPAAKSYDEIVFSYPGMFAVTVYRIAHQLFKQKVPLLPRIMTEYAHSVTGIDIHPGAQIGESFFIDHGTGVVIGETTEIGNRVRIYQGVTLGALSLPTGSGERLRGQKRHPTIKDDVVIYAGATILGARSVIGERAVIGGNVWVTDAVPPDTKVLQEPRRLIYK